MKKTLILTILIIALCSGFMIYESIEIRKFDEVTYTEDILYGDISAAEGIQIIQEVYMSVNYSRFSWANTFLIDNTGFSFVEGIEEEESEEQDTTTLADDGNEVEETAEKDDSSVVYVTNAAGETIPADEEVFEKPKNGVQLTRGYVGEYSSLREIAETVLEEHGMYTIVKFNDYVPYFSIKEKVTIDGKSYSQVDIEEPMFKLPISDDVYFVVRDEELLYPEEQLALEEALAAEAEANANAAEAGEADDEEVVAEEEEEKDPDQIYYYFVDKDGNRIHIYNLVSHYLRGNDRLYVWINNRTGDDDIQDTSEIKAGYGIYQIMYSELERLLELDLEYEEESSLAKEEGREETTVPETSIDENGEIVELEPPKRVREVHQQDKYKMFYEVDPSVIIKKIWYGYGETDEEAEQDFMLYTYEDNKAYMSVIDPITAELKKKIYLCDVPEESEVESFHVWRNDNIIIVNVNKEILSLVKKNEDGYYLLKNVDLKQLEKAKSDEWLLNGRTAVAYDDATDRLILVDYATYGGYSRYTGFKIAAFKDEELKFVGMYDSNLTYLNIPIEMLGMYKTPLTNNKLLEVTFVE